MKKCKLCNNKPVIESGHFNMAVIFYPLCKDHMKEYLRFKHDFGVK